MPLAEITRINVPSDRNVKAMCSLLPSSVLPSAWNRGSSELCLASGTILRGALKKTCSASAWLTSCLSLLLRALPASQSNPVTRVQSIIGVYYHHIRPMGQLPGRCSVPAARTIPRSSVPGIGFHACRMASCAKPKPCSRPAPICQPKVLSGSSPWRALIAAGPSGFERHLWVGAQGNQLLATGNPVLEPPETRAARTDEEIKTIAVEKLNRLLFRFRISDRDIAEVHGGTTSSN